jgi:hypothetical protein
MSNRAIPVIVAGSLGLGSAAALAATAAAEEPRQPSQRELMGQIDALKAQVERLEATTRHAGRADAPDAPAVAATVDSVLRDADRRSQFLQAQGFTAGYDKGKFVIQSEDKNFYLNPNLQLQARYVYNNREEDAADPVEGDAANEGGFEIRRMKLAFEGNVFGPDTKYKIQWATNRSGGAVTLEEAVVTHKFADAWAVKAGQYKDVTFHEETLSSKRQLAVDRSLANEFLAGGQTDFVQGVALKWEQEGRPLRAEFGYTDGPNSDNTNFVDGGGSAAFGVASPDYGAYGRLEYLAFGDWKQYEDFSARLNANDLLVLGGGAFYTEAGDGTALFHTLDAQYEVGRLGLYAAYYGVYADAGAGGDGGSAYHVGGVAQAAWVLDDAARWEVFGRYSLVALDDGDTGGGGQDNFHEITAGVNHYMHDHAAKLTLDAVWLPDGTPGNETGIGHLDPDADESQFLLRAQFQLLL